MTTRRRCSPCRFLGRWRNTNDRAVGIGAVSFRENADGGALLRVHDAGETDAVDWGETPVDLFTDGSSPDEATQMRAAYSLPSRDVLLHGWIKQGVLVIAVFSRAGAASARGKWFDREFFYRTGPVEAAES